ncbi:MAG: AAA family ATPase [Acutalibacteraceae bacterium]|nr:AAA family ATPase [Acutalibacteraceae bacterium]
MSDAEYTNLLLNHGMNIDEIKSYQENGFTLKEIYESFLNVKRIAKTAAEFGEDNTSFVWTPYIPIGDYTVLMADGGTGKTIFCCGIAASISRGECLPSASAAEQTTPANALIISAEDRGELLKKRLVSSGADLNRVYILDCMDSEGMDFTSNYDDFMDTIKRYSPKLVIIDPWHAFLGANVDINRVNAVRPVFQRLANMAKSCECGMILVSHVNKRSQSENANNAATGSTDFINAARSAMRVIFNDDPAEKDTRIIVHTKSNYAEAGKSIKFRITKDGGCQWAGFSDITRKTLEDAARFRKTPTEMLNRENTQDTTNYALIEAIREKAVAGKIVNISYEEMKHINGSDIFGIMQPKRALESIISSLKNYDISVRTGKTVKYNGKTHNGFSIYKNESIEELEADLP